MGVDHTDHVINWEKNPRGHTYIYALIIALCLHVLIYIGLTFTPPHPLQPIVDRVISIDIITPPKSKPELKTPNILPPTVPVPVPTPKLTPPVKVTPSPNLPASTQPTPSVIITQPSEGKKKDEPSANSYIPSEWALEPPLSEHRLEGIFGKQFDKDINCLRSLSEDCTELRKKVFADYQLSEQDLIWTERFAHSGLPSEFYGLSEREIRQKLAIPIAGDNGLAIFPGIVIDGNWWDSLHGVNKKCPVVRGVRYCPELRAKADDKRFNIPKKDSR